ncbi:MAG: DNA-processing protein DprA [Nocardioides sp.]|uniref:DNA-processing protein DprA n=1 Tax=Nocardioides sp. TaxID=35761 RepID=UPI0039E60035
MSPVALDALDAADAERDRLARVALGSLFEPGDPRLDSLLAGMSAVELYGELQRAEPCSAGSSPAGSPRAGGVRGDVAARLGEVRPDRILEDADRQGIRFVVPSDPEWPTQVDDLAGLEPVQERGGVPLGLWVRGPLRLDRLARSVASVGSRSATTYGLECAGQIAAGVAAEGFVVVSGGAIGIDAASHRGALAGRGATVAVLACGLDRLYPAQNTRLLLSVLDQGALVSELAPGLPVTRMRFLGRNRLIAALTRGTVLVQAAPRSGALNTANWAHRLNRLLMCVPGPISEITSLGVLEQVRQGRGVIVTRGAEVLELIARPGEHLVTERRGPAKPRDRLSARHRQVLDAVPVGRAASPASIARVAGVAIQDVATALLYLERHHLVERTAEGWRLTPGTELS